MQKTKYFTCFYHSILFFGSERCKIKFSTLFHHEKNIAINHFADIDDNDFKKIYRECTKEPYNFSTINTTLPASDPLRFRKNLFGSQRNHNN